MIEFENGLPVDQPRHTGFFIEHILTSASLAPDNPRVAIVGTQCGEYFPMEFEDEVSATFLRELIGGLLTCHIDPEEAMRVPRR